MDSFRYTSPETITDACTELSEYGERAAVLSGGQSLIPMLRQRVGDYDVVVDINGLPDRQYITLADDTIRIGCLARHKDVANSSTIEQHCQVLHEAAAEIGDLQVRSRGTICGSIAHADPSGDPPVVAAALGAEIVAESVDRTTTYDASEFYHGFYETALGSDELVTEVRFPAVSAPTGAAYEKYEPSAGAYPVATVAAVATVIDDRVTESRIYTGAIEPAPTRMTEAEEILQEGSLTEERVKEAAVAVGEQTDPMGDSDGSPEFKTELTKTLARRALKTAISRAGGTL